MSNKFKIGDLVKVYKRGMNGFLHKGEIILIQMGVYLVKLDNIEEPEGFQEYEMEIDLETIRNIKLSELLD